MENEQVELTEEQEKAEADQQHAGGQFLAQIKAREHEFETGWWKRAERSEKLYNLPCKDKGDDPVYNILYSNTEVLLPSLYSATAKPDVRGRFKDTSIKPIPEVCERFLTIATDGSQPGVESFDDAVKSVVLSSLVSASGVMRLRLYPEQEFPLQYESVPYRDFLWGKAPKWARVPWVAFRHELRKDEMVKLFNLSEEEVVKQFTPAKSEVDDSELPTCLVYEFWHKASKEVWFISEEWASKVLMRSPDPLEVKGFYPTPGPLLMTLKASDLEPVPLYEYYAEQADELNRVSTRLNKVISAIRVRGVYNPLLGGDLGQLLSAGNIENELVPGAEAAMLAQSGGFDKHIWMLPIKELVAVAQQLYTAREQIKQVIYELTGISDIIRGSNVASETATATNTKNKWGTVRLRKMQTLVANYIRDIFRLSIDCGSAKIPAAVWKQLIQLPIPMEAEKMKVQQQVAQQMQMAQMTGQPPQEDPKLKEVLASPSMEEILAKISSDVDRTFTINIQTSSTIDLETASDKAEVGEFMNAMGQLLAGLQPLAGLGPTGLNAAKTILTAVCKRYKFGLEIVESVEAIEAPPPQSPEAPKGPPPPSPEEQQLLQAETQAKMAQVQADMEVIAAKKQLELARIDHDRQMLALALEKSQIEIDAARAKAAVSRMKNATVSL